MKKPEHAIFAIAVGAVSAVAIMYLTELMLGSFLVLSPLINPLPAYSRQIHETGGYRAAYHYNNVSMRGGDFKPYKHYDVTLLGDSFMFGIGVDDEESLGNLLGQGGMRVLNLSEPATNPIQYAHKLVFFRKRGLETSNIVIGLYMGNDFQSISDKTNVGSVLDRLDCLSLSDYGVIDFLFLARFRYFISALVDKIFRPHNFIIHRFERKKRFRKDWIEWYTDGKRSNIEKMRGIQYKAVKDDREYLTRAEINTASIEKTSRIINDIGRSLKGQSAVYLVVIPDRHFALGELGDDYRKSVKTFLEHIGHDNIIILDLHNNMKSWFYYENDGHWNAVGHAFVSDYLARSIAR